MILITVVLGVLVVLPLWTSHYIISTCIFIGIYGMAALGVSVLMGYAGQVNLGSNAFMLTGAYISAVLSVDLGVSPWLGTLCAAFVTAVIAYLIGKAILWLHGFILAVATACFAVVMYRLACELEITRGVYGLMEIPHYSIGGFVLDKEIHYYYLVLMVLLFLSIITSNLIRSRVGCGFTALNLFHGGSEVASESVGINVAKLKVHAFVLSAVYGSVGGSIYAHYTTCLTPQPFNLWWGLVLIMMCTIGGMRSVLGPIIGSTIYIALKEVLRITPSGTLAGFETFAFGLLFTLSLIFMPHGIIELPSLVGQSLKKFYKTR